jgi:hypothetical protein
MPNENRFQGTRDDHFAAMDRHGTRCDANARMCVNPANVEYVLLRANGHGKPLAGATPIRRKACSRHKLVYGSSGSYRVLETIDLARSPRAKAS